MGSSDAVRKVEEQLPGMRFTVVESSRGKLVGRIVLMCTIENEAMWPVVVEKLNGLKLFSTFENEVLDALSYAIDLKEDSLKQLKKQLAAEKRKTAELSREVARLQGILSDVGLELGLS